EILKVPIQSNIEVQLLFGNADGFLKIIEHKLSVEVLLKSEGLEIKGKNFDEIHQAGRTFESLLHLIRGGRILEEDDIRLAIRNSQSKLEAVSPKVIGESIPVFSKRGSVRPRTPGQHKYTEAIKNHDLVFGIGPAGTGKTYLAMAMAISAFKSGKVSRIILTRPAVEAGEKLGFLPGDIADKIDPYLRPIFDALYDMIPNETLDRYIEQNVIEVAPIAFMRGRTLNDSFIVFDEAQNSTIDQMKMFLTRLGFSSKAVVTGDITQTDLPSSRVSGLIDAQNVLKGVEGVEFVYFSTEDVVRHELVQRIIEAYDSHGIT
ncbi:MAG: PhoH family protein, partial [Candidatus Poribacteria bacterium]|nr:PhoH family protein [Candidatus Poribacteria bacterium]